MEKLLQDEAAPRRNTISRSLPALTSWALGWVRALESNTTD
jgi:hypothetical protein